MTQAVVKAIDEARFAFEHDGEERPLPLRAETIADWIARYAETIAMAESQSALAALGREMTAVLNQDGALDLWLRAPGPRVLEIRSDEEDSARLFDPPWEILTKPDGAFLAADRARLFVLSRRHNRPAPPKAAAPLPGDLSLLFMAAAPEGELGLDFEAEEAAILEATRDQSLLRLVVEESGSLEGLRSAFIGALGPFQAAHLSCHAERDPDRGPVLMLEAEEGGAAIPTSFEDLILKFRSERRRPELVFLCASQTARTARASSEAAASFAKRMISAGLGAVLGWDDSRRDQDVMLFTKPFYGRLCEGESPQEAVAYARAELLRANAADPKTGSRWHLARLHLGSSGGSPLCDPAAARVARTARRRSPALLDNKGERVPVTASEDFVGRRRESQRLLRVFRKAVDEGRGAIIHGENAMGKSSLANRIADRLADRQRVVVHERFEAAAIFGGLLDAVQPSRKRELIKNWADDLRADPSLLVHALGDLLQPRNLFSPILLIVDALDHILERPQGGAEGGLYRIRNNPGAPEHWRQAVRGLLQAFRKDRSESGILFTSRYDFALPNAREDDDARWLVRVALSPPPQIDEVKQSRRQTNDQAAKRRIEDFENARPPAPPRPQPAPQAQIQIQAQAQTAPSEPPFLGPAPSHPPPPSPAPLPFLGFVPSPVQALEAEAAPSPAEADLSGGALSPKQRALLHAAFVFLQGFGVVWSALRATGDFRAEEAVTQEALRRMAALGLVERDPETGRPRLRPEAAEVLPEVMASWIQTAGAALPAAEPEAQAQARQPLGFALSLPEAEGAASEEGARLSGEVWSLIAELQNRVWAERAALEPDFAPSPPTSAAPSEAAEPEAERGAEGSPQPLRALSWSAAQQEAGERPGPEDRKTERRDEAVEAFAAGAKALGPRPPYEGRPKIWAAVAKAVRKLRGIAPRPLAGEAEAAPRAAAPDEARRSLASLAEIADLSESRGQLKTALRLRRNAILPAYVRLDDDYGQAFTLGRIASTLIAMGGLEDERAAEIHSLVRQSFADFQRLEAAEEIAAMGALQAQLLIRLGELDAALQTLAAAKAAFERLDDPEGLALCARLEQIVHQIRAMRRRGRS